MSSKDTLNTYNMHNPANNDIKLPLPNMPYADLPLAYLKAKTTLYLCGSRYLAATDECFRLRIGSEEYEPARMIHHDGYAPMGVVFLFVPDCSAKNAPVPGPLHHSVQGPAVDGGRSCGL